MEWSPCGFKLYAGSSDGSISILELVNKQWKSYSFKVSEASIVSFALQPVPLGEIIAADNQDSFYPRIATISKDQRIRIWAHTNEKKYCEKCDHFDGKKGNTAGYVQIKEHLCDKETLGNLIWRPSGGVINDALKRC